jgi:hypothetical protein
MRTNEIGYLTWLPDSDPSIALAQILHREKQEAIAMMRATGSPNRKIQKISQAISIGYLIWLLIPPTRCD